MLGGMLIRTVIGVSVLLLALAAVASVDARRAQSAGGEGSADTSLIQTSGAAAELGAESSGQHHRRSYYRRQLKQQRLAAARAAHAAHAATSKRFVSASSGPRRAAPHSAVAAGAAAPVPAPVEAMRFQSVSADKPVVVKDPDMGFLKQHLQFSTWAFVLIIVSICLAGSAGGWLIQKFTNQRTSQSSDNYGRAYVPAGDNL